MAESPRIEELRRRLDREPGSRLFAQLAEELRKGGSAAEAAAVARQGLGQHPGYTSARLTLARSLLEMGQHGPARAELEAVLRAAPDNILASRLLGDCLITMGDLGSALLQLRATLRLSGGDPSIETQIQALEVRLHGRGAEAGAEAGVADAERDEQGETALPLLLESSSEEAAGQGEGTEGTAVEAGELAVEVRGELGAAGDAVARVSPDSEEPESQRRGAAETSWVSMGPVEGALLDAWPAEREGDALRAAGGAVAGEPPASTEPTASVAGALEVTAFGSEDREEARGDDAPTLSSATLAELYYRQGSPEKAVEVYGDLLRREPGNDRAKRRLAEIEALLRGGAGLAGSEGAVRVAETISRLERWLDAVRSTARREYR